MRELRRVGVMTSEGFVNVPASDHLDCIPYFALTMANFGQFEITHRPSGYRVLGGFERAANAYVCMARIQLALNELGIDASSDRETFLGEIKSKDRNCESLGMTLRQWIAISNQIGSICSEFPWENEEDGPHADLEKLINQLQKKLESSQ